MDEEIAVPIPRPPGGHPIQTQLLEGKGPQQGEVGGQHPRGQQQQGQGGQEGRGGGRRGRGECVQFFVLVFRGGGGRGLEGGEGGAEVCGAGAGPEEDLESSEGSGRSGRAGRNRGEDSLLFAQGTIRLGTLADVGKKSCYKWL